MGDEQWIYARSLATIADIFSRTFARMGNCRFPLYIPGEEAGEWSDIWRLITEQRMARNEWAFSSVSTQQETLRPTLALFRTVAGRNHARTRRRFLRARYFNLHDDTVDVWENGARHVAPSDDESLPAESLEETLNLPEHFSPPLSSLDPHLTAQCVKRPEDTLESGSAKEPRTGRGTLQEVNMGKKGIINSNEDNIRLALAPDDEQNAIHLRTAGQPPYRAFYGCDSPAPLADADLRTAHPFSLDPKTTYRREWERTQSPGPSPRRDLKRPARKNGK